MNRDEKLFELVDVLECDNPKTIKEIEKEISYCSGAALRKLNSLADAGVIVRGKRGQKYYFWKNFVSDRQAGLKLRSFAFDVKELYSKVNELIDLTESPRLENGNGGS